MRRRTPSIVLVGAGLQTSLIALGALRERPDARITILERSGVACGNHTWSMHAGDVPAALEPIVTPLLTARWDAYDVRFPDGDRTIPLGYQSMSSDAVAAALVAAVEEAPNAELITDVTAVDIAEHAVRVEDGLTFEADLVVDARGPTPMTGGTGYQKFVGVELETETPHGVERPLLMDASVAQEDGFRFLYVLPFAPTRLLVEDTAFSGRDALDVDAWRANVWREAEARGWTPAAPIREEHGVLPMPFLGQGPVRQRRGPLRAGYRGGWFHAATGFSFPVAARLAALVAAHTHAPTRLFTSPAYRKLVARERSQARFTRFLNRLLFTGVRPETRWTIFARFYRMPLDVIARFYAGQIQSHDRGHLLLGKPPRGFSLRSALLGRAIG